MYVPNLYFNYTKFLLIKSTKLITLEPLKYIEHQKNVYVLQQIIHLNTKINKLAPISMAFEPFCCFYKSLISLH